MYLCPPTHKLVNPDEKCLGVTYFRRLEICLSTGQTQSEIYSTLVHEFLHVAMHRAALPHQWEEQIVTMSEPFIASLLAASFMRFPPLPKGCKLKSDPVNPDFRVSDD